MNGFTHSIYYRDMLVCPDPMVFGWWWPWEPSPRISLDLFIFTTFQTLLMQLMYIYNCSSSNWLDSPFIVLELSSSSVSNFLIFCSRTIQFLHHIPCSSDNDFFIFLIVIYSFGFYSDWLNSFIVLELSRLMVLDFLIFYSRTMYFLPQINVFIIFLIEFYSFGIATHSFLDLNFKWSILIG